jgi:hypothetical protein
LSKSRETPHIDEGLEEIRGTYRLGERAVRVCVTPVEVEPTEHGKLNAHGVLLSLDEDLGDVTIPKPFQYAVKLESTGSDYTGPAAFVSPHPDQGKGAIRLAARYKPNHNLAKAD